MNPTSPFRARAVLMSTPRQNYPVPGSREPRERLLGPISASALTITPADGDVTFASLL